MPPHVGVRQNGMQLLARKFAPSNPHRVTARRRRHRQRAAEILGGTPEVAEWEIAVMRRDHRSTDGACARVTWLRGDPAALNRAADVFKLALMPEMETFDGFCGVSLMINPETGLAVTSVRVRQPRGIGSNPGTSQRGCGREARPKPSWRSWKSPKLVLALAPLDVPELV